MSENANAIELLRVNVAQSKEIQRARPATTDLLHPVSIEQAEAALARLADAERAAEAAKSRARRACQHIVAEIGADGPLDVDQAAERIVKELRLLRRHTAGVTIDRTPDGGMLEVRFTISKRELRTRGPNALEHAIQYCRDAFRKWMEDDAKDSAVDRARALNTALADAARTKGRTHHG